MVQTFRLPVYITFLNSASHELLKGTDYLPVALTLYLSSLCEQWTHHAFSLQLSFSVCVRTAISLFIPLTAEARFANLACLGIAPYRRRKSTVFTSWHLRSQTIQTPNRLHQLRLHRSGSRPSTHLNLSTYFLTHQSKRFLSGLFRPHLDQTPACQPSPLTQTRSP